MLSDGRVGDGSVLVNLYSILCQPASTTFSSRLSLSLSLLSLSSPPLLAPSVMSVCGVDGEVLHGRRVLLVWGEGSSELEEVARRLREEGRAETHLEHAERLLMGACGGRDAACGWCLSLCSSSAVETRWLSGRGARLKSMVSLHACCIPESESSSIVTCTCGLTHKVCEIVSLEVTVMQWSTLKVEAHPRAGFGLHHTCSTWTHS